jgi:hypothetical protein
VVLVVEVALLLVAVLDVLDHGVGGGLGGDDLDGAGLGAGSRGGESADGGGEDEGSRGLHFEKLEREFWVWVWMS